MNAVTFTEREAIKKMMDYIEREQARLSNQYFGLLDRLRELDQIENPSANVIGSGLPEGKVEELSGEIPMQIPMSIMNNYNSGSPFLPTVNDIKAVPQGREIELEEEEARKSLLEAIAEFDFKQEEQAIIPKTEIEAQKDKDEKNKPVKTSSQRDVKVVTQFIKAILKEVGVPIRTSELIKRLAEAGINTSSPYVLLQQASQYDPRIEKPKFGFYQYNFSA